MSGPDDTKDSRAARLAEALRENLRRRKSQSRARRRPAPEATRGTEGTEAARDGRDGGRDNGGGEPPRD